ncbi:MAG: 50S ribosomal protein L25 [Spirochaetes bacterium]|nr:50S ribosomal protein L25 [Spirochaetota bacterium]
MKNKEVTVLDAKKREISKKSQLRKFRMQGYTPFVIYGPDIKDNVYGVAKENDLVKILKEFGENHKIKVKMENKEYDVLIKDFEYNTLKSRLYHVDFYKISTKHSVKVSVPIIYEGVSAGEKAGGIVEKFMHHIEIEGLISDIPESITINMDNFNIGKKMHVYDLKLPENIKILSPKDEVIFVIKGHVEETITTTEGPSAEEVAKAAEIFD